MAKKLVEEIELDTMEDLSLVEVPMKEVKETKSTIKKRLSYGSY